ncbi:hypothetical protein [Streptomyces sp. NPDC002671]
MTLSAALPPAALRVMRAVAGRRALQLALLVGGVFALGLLCGQQAHAAEGGPAVPVPQTVASVQTTVTEKAVTPVREVTRTASRALDSVLPRVPEVPKQSPDQLPTQVPVDLPVDLPTGSLPTVPHGKASSRPQPHAGPVQAAPAAPRVHAEGRHAVPASVPVPAPQPVAEYGPDAAFAPHGATHPSVHRATAPVEAPSHPAPSGDPDSALGKQAADGSATRHGDGYAITLDDRAPLRLLPGAAARVDAPRTRERHRDIPVFPG